jgi:transcriptional regulator with XRE-family HTH domain
METFGNIIRDARTKKGLTCRELIKLIKDKKHGLSPSYLTMLEGDRSMPSMRLLVILSELLDLDSKMLFGVKRDAHVKAIVDRLQDEYDMAAGR